MAEIAEDRARLRARAAEGETVPLEIAYAHLEMERELVVDIRVRVPPEAKPHEFALPSTLDVSPVSRLYTSNVKGKPPSPDDRPPSSLSARR